MSPKKKQNNSLAKYDIVEANRFDRIDALRGFAMVWMTIFHFCFDLNAFGFIIQNFYEDSFWTVQRNVIVSLFLFCAGLSQALAIEQRLSWERFWKRWRQVAGAALLVTAASYFTYPESFIYFGVLHAIAIMLILMRLTYRLNYGLWILGAVFISMKFVVPYLFAGAGLWLDIFNHPFLNWLGIISYKPRTEDYVPLIPWLGVMWLGLATGKFLLRNRIELLARPLPNPLQGLAFMGRYSLSYYLIHQPVLYGLVMLVRKIIG